MRGLKFCLVVFAFLLVSAASAVAGPFDNCELETRKDSNSSGRFIWKQKGAHFNQAVIVAPRRYFPSPPQVRLYKLDGKLIETTRLKSTGQCSGHPECLFAATYLAAKPGSHYNRKYGPIIVRFLPRRVTSTAFCKIFQVTKPHRRAEYKG